MTMASFGFLASGGVAGSAAAVGAGVVAAADGTTAGAAAVDAPFVVLLVVAFVDEAGLTLSDSAKLAFCFLDGKHMIAIGERVGARYCGSLNFMAVYKA